jgi:hypothetical protein
MCRLLVGACASAAGGRTATATPVARLLRTSRLVIGALAIPIDVAASAPLVWTETPRMQIQQHPGGTPLRTDEDPGPWAPQSPGVQRGGLRGPHAPVMQEPRCADSGHRAYNSGHVRTGLG